MSALFSKPSTPKTVTYPTAPTLANTDTDAAAQQMQQSLNRGRTSTYLTGGSGLSNTGDTKKVLLGS